MAPRSLHPTRQSHAPDHTLEGERHLGQIKSFTRLQRDRFKSEFVIVVAHDDVLGCAADIVPPVAIQGALQPDPIEFAVPQEVHLRLCRNHRVNLFQQGEMARSQGSGLCAL